MKAARWATLAWIAMFVEGKNAWAHSSLMEAGAVLFPVPVWPMRIGGATATVPCLRGEAAGHFGKGSHAFLCQRIWRGVTLIFLVHHFPPFEVLHERSLAGSRASSLRMSGSGCGEGVDSAVVEAKLRSNEVELDQVIDDLPHSSFGQSGC